MDHSEVCGLLETLLALLSLNLRIPEMLLMLFDNGEKRSRNRGPPLSWGRHPPDDYQDDYQRRGPPPQRRSPRTRSFSRSQSRSLSRDRRRERSLSRERNHKPSLDPSQSL